MHDFQHGKPRAMTALTDKQMQILRMIVDGKQSKQICHQLNVSDSTLDSHLKAMYSKTGTDSRITLVVYAFRSRIIQIDGDFVRAVVNLEPETPGKPN